MVVFTTVALGAVTGPLLDALIGTAAEDEGAALLDSVASVRHEDSLRCGGNSLTCKPPQPGLGVAAALLGRARHCMSSACMQKLGC